MSPNTRTQIAIPRTRRPWARRGIWLALAGLALLLITPLLPARMASAAPPPVEPGPDWTLVEGANFTYAIAPNDHANAETFSALHGETLERAVAELSLFFDYQITQKIAVRGYADGTTLDLARQTAEPVPLPGIAAVADPRSFIISLDVSAFVALSEREADTALRHAVAQIMVGAASNYNLPDGFAQGIALYAERPTTPQLARYAAVLANANSAPPLPSWFDINRSNASIEIGELLPAAAYSVTAFLIDRYTISAFQAFLKVLQAGAEGDWRLAMREAYDRDPTEMESLWVEDVPRWVSGSDWRNNLVAAFDLTPAQELFAQARYAEAKVTLDRSQLLYSNIGDREMLTQVQDLLQQCDRGLQAESLMQQAQEALERHSYDRAQALLLQAREQYRHLPADHQPEQLLVTYETLAANGIDAGVSLSEAQRLGRQWGDYPDAREQALTAGTTYAALGDEEMTNRATGVLDDLDARQRRLVLMLGALSVITVTWLLLWLWSRGRSELDWN